MKGEELLQPDGVLVPDRGDEVGVHLEVMPAKLTAWVHEGGLDIVVLSTATIDSYRAASSSIFDARATAK